MVEQLAVAMMPVLGGLSALVPSEFENLSSEMSVSFNPENTVQLLDELTEMLDEMDPGAEDKAVVLGDISKDTVDQKIIRNLIKSNAEFEFDEANEILADIKEILKQ